MLLKISSYGGTLIQCEIAIIAAMVNLLNTIWHVRNQARFSNKRITWKLAISMIIVDTTMFGNNTSKVSSNSIRDFTVLKHFKINIHNPRVPVLKEIVWHPHLPNWIKCNIDGASKDNPAELCGAMRAIEIAHQMHWNNLWMETDSAIVVSAFKNLRNPIPWS
ncbi:hypothetical protein TSUD_277710 [Trifolium subterraneum]|uniref:RNase H type-1 domain-containing protein n=1 Tax=Trifolium subterraneum TaxID=3900 RepID=A0A2Z6NL10_TRISU|nr:hypothetical protein TSUD_277710 [Trifolium subterraneum]